MPAERQQQVEVRVAAVVLAAGTSSRLGDGRLKQLLAPAGEPLVRRTCRLALESGLEPVVVVLGHRAEEVATAVADLEVSVTLNPEYAEGLSTSVRRGLAALQAAAVQAKALQAPVDGVMFLPCDQPFLGRDTLGSLIASFASSGECAHRRIVVPTSGGRRGAPVLFGAAFLAELAGLRGDEGGRQILDRHAERVSEVELPSERPLFDIDSEEDVEHALRSSK